MCRAKNDPQGYFRCNKRKCILDAVKEMNALSEEFQGEPKMVQSYPEDAFWITAGIVEMDEVKRRISIYQSRDFKGDYSSEMEEIVAIGADLGSAIDCSIPNLKERLESIYQRQQRLESLGSLTDLSIKENEDIYMNVREPIIKDSLKIQKDLYGATVLHLKKVRSFGGKIDVDTSKHRVLEEPLARSLELYPSQWISSLPPKPFRFFKSRDPNETSFYHGETAQMHIKLATENVAVYDLPEDAPKEQVEQSLLKKRVVHELGHVFEHNSNHFSSLEKAFLDSRKYTSLYTGKPLEFPSIENGGDCYLDHFISDYMGRNYGGQSPATEISTTGMQALFSGQYGSFVGVDIRRPRLNKADPDHRNFMLGLLSAVVLEKNSDAEIKRQKRKISLARMSLRKIPSDIT